MSNVLMLLHEEMGLDFMYFSRSLDCVSDYCKADFMQGPLKNEASPIF
jgi:hypothetical protein